MHFLVSLCCVAFTTLETQDPVLAELLKTLQRNSKEIQTNWTSKVVLIKLEFYKLKWLKLNKIVAANWFKFILLHELRETLDNRPGIITLVVVVNLETFCSHQTGDLLLCSNNADVSKIWDKKFNFFNNSALTLQQSLRSGLSQYPMLVREQILSESKCQFHASASWGRRYICT